MALRSVMLCLFLLVNFSSAASSWLDQDAGKPKMRKETSAEEVAQETKPIVDLHEADAELEDGAESQDGAELQEEDIGDAELEEGDAELEVGDEAEMGEADEEDESEADMGKAEEEDSDLHYVPQKSLLELAQMHEHGNATKSSILALISDEFEQSLPDDEVMVPIRLAGHTEHFPKILEHMEPTAFVEAVMKGRSDPDLKPVQLQELRQESGADEEEEQEDGAEDQEGDQELAEDEDGEEDGVEEGEGESDDGEESAGDTEEDKADPFIGEDSSDAAIRKKLKQLGLKKQFDD